MREAGNRILDIRMGETDKGTAKLSPELMRIVKPTEYFRHIDRSLRLKGFLMLKAHKEPPTFEAALETRRAPVVQASDVDAQSKPHHVHWSDARLLPRRAVAPRDVGQMSDEIFCDIPPLDGSL